MAITSRGIRGWLYKALEMPAPVQSLGSLAATFDSDVADGQLEKIDWLGMIPGFKEWKDKRQESEPVDFNWTILSKKFEDSFQVPTKWARNDKVQQIQNLVNGFAARIPDLWNDLVAQLINASESTLCFDQQNFFSTTHAWGQSGTLSNKLAPSAATPLAPTPAECAKAIVAMYKQFYTFLDDRGRPLTPNLTNLTVVCPVGTMDVHYQAITQNFLSTGTTQIDNPVLGLKEGMGVNFDLVTSPLITLANSRVLLINRTPGSKPFIKFENGAERRYSQKAEGSDFEHDKDKWAFGLTIAGNAGLGHFCDAIEGIYT